jgi:hypothetical protein
MSETTVKTKNRPDKVEYEKRMFAIQAWMIDGVPSSLIVKQIQDKGWSKSDRHSEILVQKARARWIKFEDENILDKRKMKVQRLMNMIRGMSSSDKTSPTGIRAILQVEKEINKLEGLYFDPDKVAPVTINVNLSENEIKDINKTLEESF